MTTTVQAILQEHFAGFAATHPLADYQHQAAARLRDCRTAALGGHWRVCPHGHVRTPHYNSCHHRSCPLCNALPREQWLADWKERLLACPHVHTVFTTPHDLIPLWRYNKELFASLLFRAASGALQELLADPEYLGARPGLLSGLHTWDQKLLIHPHVHVLVTFGGLTADGQWVEPKRNCLLPRKVLMKKFRGKLTAYLQKALDSGDLVLPPNQKETQVRSLLNRCGVLTWNVKILKQYAHGRGVLTYLARYLKGGPIGHGRLLDCRDGMVRFWYLDRRDEEADGPGGRKLQALPVDQFLARFLEHVPPPNLQTVRGYGLYAGVKHEELAVARQQFGQKPSPAKQKITWRDLCARAGNVAATVCPVCGGTLLQGLPIAPCRGGAGPQLPRQPTQAVQTPPVQAQPPPAKVA